MCVDRWDSVVYHVYVNRVWEKGSRRFPFRKRVWSIERIRTCWIIERIRTCFSCFVSLRTDMFGFSPSRLLLLSKPRGLANRRRTGTALGVVHDGASSLSSLPPSPGGGRKSLLGTLRGGGLNPFSRHKKEEERVPNPSLNIDFDWSGVSDDDRGSFSGGASTEQRVEEAKRLHTAGNQ